MTGLIVFLSVYALVMAWFFVALLRWTLRTQRGSCACGGSLVGGTFSISHGAQMCYPSAEGLHPLSR